MILNHTINFISLKSGKFLVFIEVKLIFEETLVSLKGGND